MDRDNTFDCINKLINFNRLIYVCTVVRVPHVIKKIENQQKIDYILPDPDLLDLYPVSTSVSLLRI